MDARQIQKGREEICRISAMLFAKGLVSGKDGNISVRISADEMLVTPSGVCKAFLEPEMILRQRFDGTVVEGELRSTREAGMHSRLYELRPEIGAIVHSHRLCGLRRGAAPGYPARGACPAGENRSGRLRACGQQGVDRGGGEMR